MSAPREYKGVKLGNSRYHPVHGLCLCDENGQFVRDSLGEPVPDPSRNKPRPPAVTREGLVSRQVQRWNAHETGSSVTTKDDQPQ
jgi:hypothetical protein